MRAWCRYARSSLLNLPLYRVRKNCPNRDLIAQVVSGHIGALRSPFGRLRPSTPFKIHAENDRSQGGAAIARGRTRDNGISVAVGQGSATPANKKSCSNGRGLANRIDAID